MNQVFTIYSVFFLATALVSFFVAFLAWHRRSVKGARELIWLMIAAGLGAFWIIFETSSTTMSEKIFWSKLEYFGGVATPVLYLIFVLRFTGKDVLLSSKNIILLFIIPVITLFLTITNEKHNLIWSGFSAISEKTNLMEYYHGIWFWIGYIAYTYLILLLASIYLFNFIIQHTRTFRTQGLIVLAGGLFPWIVSIIYLTGINPVPGLDLAPVSIVLSGTLAAYAILYFRFLDLVPVARETLVETLSDGILALDEQNRIQDINEAALTFLGIKNKNIIGSLAGSSGATDMLLLKAVIDQESTDQVEIISKNETKTFRVIKKEIRNQPGSRLVVIRDITESVRSEEALLKSENQKAAILRAIPDLLFVFNQNGEYLDVYSENDSKLLVPKEALIGKSIRDLFPPDIAEGAIEAFRKSFQSKKLVQFSYSININGKMEFYEARIVPAPDDKVLAIVRDITERKQSEQELIKAKEHAEESDRLKSAFLANMSHEIRTPMNSILGFTDLLITDNITDNQQQEYIRIIKKGGDRLLNIINDIIDISKIESGQMKVSYSKTNINKQIEYISSFFKPEIEEKGIKLICRNTLPTKEAIIITDKEKMFAILTNLVKNAIKFTREGVIEFGYLNKVGHLEFYVKDTGIGIRQEQREYIFERFRQGSESLARNYEGTGLGLSISKAYVEMLGGKIWVETELGKGSVFYFTIPYISETESETKTECTVPVNAADKQVKGLKILIAEDDEASIILISHSIKSFCREILKVKTGSAAVEFCSKYPDIDLVLMDIRMSEMDGYEATRRIRQFNKDVIIIAQTAFALLGDRERALEAGCNDYISKPVDTDHLKVLIQKYFNK
jgi:PAS domain S-box-containing protein